MGQHELHQRPVSGSAQLDSSRCRQGGARIDADLFCLRRLASILLCYGRADRAKDQRSYWAVYSSGFCRVDCVGGKNFSILEVNPVARIDASDYGVDVPCAIIKYAKELCIE